MKNLLITLDYAPHTGGVARYLGNLVAYFSPSIDVEAELNTLLFTRIRPTWLKAVIYLIRNRKMHDQILVSQVLPLGTAAWMAKGVTQTPYLIFLHGMDFHSAKLNTRKSWIMKRVLQGARLVVCNSQALENEVRAFAFSVSTLVVYPSIASSSDVSALKTLGTPLRLLTVSRLVPRKGHTLVLEALRVLKEKSELHHFAYTIVGNGPELEHLQEIIHCYHLQEAVRIVPEASDADVARCYAEADLFVMPTLRRLADREGFGMVYLEAAAYGMPSVGSDLPGVNEAIIHGKTGLLIQEGNIEAFVQALRTLQKDRVLLGKLGDLARARVRDEFSGGTQWEKLRSYV